MTREEAIKVLNGMLYLNYRNFWDEECDKAIDMAIEALTEDKADKLTGEWIRVTNGRGGHECSKCHAYAPSYMSGDEYLSNYCPNCGARMTPYKGGDNE